MTGDLIKRDSIRVDVALYMASNAYLNDTALDVLKMIDKWLCEAEAVDAEPVRHRRWIKKRTTLKYISHYECSACGSWQGMYWMNYCPNCGAKMDGGKE